MVKDTIFILSYFFYFKKPGYGSVLVVDGGMKAQRKVGEAYARVEQNPKIEFAKPFSWKTPTLVYVRLKGLSTLK